MIKTKSKTKQNKTKKKKKRTKAKQKRKPCQHIMHNSSGFGTYFSQMMKLTYVCSKQDFTLQCSL